MSQGNFVCGLLPEIQVMIEAGWADNRTNIDYIAETETAKRIIEQQTVEFGELKGEKNRTVSLKWLQACAITDQDRTDDCSFTGPELEGGCQDYELTQEKEVTFSVKRIIEPRNSIYETKEKIAIGFLKAMKVLDERLSRRAALELDSFAGVNAHTSMYTVSGTDTIIPAASWTVGLAAYFALVKIKNKFNSPWLLSGENLFSQNWNALIDAGNSDGSGNANRARTMPIYFDVFNIDSQLSPDKKTFMLEKGSTAIVSKAYYQNYNQNNVYDAAQFGNRWSIDSKNLPGVKYDVYHTITCSGSEITDNFKVVAIWDTFLNPTGCTPTNTGVLSFSCA